MLKKMLGAALLLTFFLAGGVGCKRNKPQVRPPIAETPSRSSPASAPKAGSPSIPAPPLFVDRPLPPASTLEEVKPHTPPPDRLPVPSPSRRSADSRKPSATPSAVETRTLAPPSSGSGLQLTPQLSEEDRTAMLKEITQDLDSAKAKIRVIDASTLTPQQRTNLVALLDFVRKAEDSLKRGDYYQSLMLARKANTLAVNLASAP